MPFALREDGVKENYPEFISQAGALLPNSRGIETYLWRCRSSWLIDAKHFRRA